MKLRMLLPLAVLTVALIGCSASPSTDPGAGASSEETTDGGEPTTEPWSECPEIIERLNGNESDPTVYEQLEPGDFVVPEVGADVLEEACVIRVTVNEDPIMWAILPGDDALVDSITSALVAEGFVAGAPGLYGDQATGRGVTVNAYATGADLDAYLVYSTSFAPITEPIVMLGSFALS